MNPAKEREYSMSERKRHKSSVKEVPNPSNSNGIIAQPDPELAKALEEVAQSLPQRFFVDDWAIERLVRDYKGARRQKRSGNHEMNTIFDHLYGAYVHLNAHPEALDKFFYNCGCKGVTVDLDGDLSKMLVEFYVRGRSRMSEKCAPALCQAALQKVKVGFLAQRLGNVGPHNMRTMEALLQPTSIKAMAKAFADRQRKLRKPRSRGKQ
jgi:hypothetical protein